MSTPTKSILTPVMVSIEGGIYRIGGTSEVEEQPMHSVTVSSFDIGKFPVSVAEYQSFCAASNHQMPEPPPWGWKLNHPMVNVSFEEARDYCRYLSQQTLKKFRLPTEAEWEYAARGGNKSNGYLYPGSNEPKEVGWYRRGTTQTIGKKKPNELGLFDMSGNVWEWCLDRYGRYTRRDEFDPTGPRSGSERVIRGGSWFNPSDFGRVSCRRSYLPKDRGISVGFRVVNQK